MSKQFEHGYAVIIGVDTVARTAQLALPAVAKDVDALYNVLVAPNYCAYKPENVRLLSGEEATRANILDALDWLETSVKADSDPDKVTAVIYYSGHGGQNENSTGDTHFLLPHDYRWRDPFGSGLVSSQFAKKVLEIQASRVLAILDCCHAAGMDTKELGSIPEQFLEHGFKSAPFPLDVQGVPEDDITKDGEKGKKSVAALMIGNGRAVLNSCQANESSYVLEDDTMSIFTHHLIEALTGHATQDPEAESVLVTDVMSWVQRKVPQSAEKERKKPQTPVMRVNGVFPVAMILGGAGTKGVNLPKPKDVVKEVAKTAAPVQTIINQTVGERGVIVGGSVNGSIVTGDRNHINSHNRRGDTIHVGNITGSQGVAIGRHASARVTITQTQQSQFEQLVAQLENALAQVGANQTDDAADVQDEVNDLKAELASDNPAPRKLRKYGERLLEAANKFAVAVPPVVVAAEKIVTFVRNVV